MLRRSDCESSATGRTSMPILLPTCLIERGQKGCKSQRMEGSAVKCCLLYMEYLLHTWAHSNCGYLPIIAKGLTSSNSGTNEKGYWGPSLRWGAIGRQWQQWEWETNTVLEIWSLAESFSFFRLLKLIIQSYSRIWNSCSISLFTYVPFCSRLVECRFWRKTMNLVGEVSLTIPGPQRLKCDS